MVLLIIGGAAVRVVIGDDALAYYKRNPLEDHNGARGAATQFDQQTC